MANKTETTLPIVMTIIIVACVGGYLWSKNEECKAKGGIIARPLFGMVKCVKEVP